MVALVKQIDAKEGQICVDNRQLGALADLAGFHAALVGNIRHQVADTQSRANRHRKELGALHGLLVEACALLIITISTDDVGPKFRGRVDMLAGQVEQGAPVEV